MNWEEPLTELPKPNVEHVRTVDELNEAGARGMLSNPIYAGVPPYSRVVSDAAWVHAAAALIREEGPEQFLVNLLHVLRSSMSDVLEPEAETADENLIWAVENEHGEAEGEPDGEDDTPSPWQMPMEGVLFCSHDNLPMLYLGDEYVCVAEYLDAHLDGSPINDIITSPAITLIFQNGHTLPLLCPDCGQSLHVQDEGWFLDELNGLTLVGLWWDDEEESLVMEFGYPDDENEDAIHSVPVHLNSVRGLTCPHATVLEDQEEQP